MTPSRNNGYNQIDLHPHQSLNPTSYHIISTTGHSDPPGDPFQFLSCSFGAGWGTYHGWDWDWALYGKSLIQTPYPTPPPTRGDNGINELAWVGTLRIKDCVPIQVFVRTFADVYVSFRLSKGKFQDVTERQSSRKKVICAYRDYWPRTTSIMGFSLSMRIASLLSNLPHSLRC